MSLKLYIDLMSQPSRSLYILLKTVKCNFEPKLINLAKGQQFSEEFTKLNRFQKVPVIDHNGFVLTESVAILKHLSRENIIPDSLYPKDSKERARVDEFLAWHHIGLRLFPTAYFRVKYLEPLLTGKPADPKEVDGWERRMVAALNELNTKWLGRGNDFILGNKPTVADVMAACEVEHPRAAGYDPKENFENIGVWSKKVQDHFNPYYDEAHVVMNKVVKKNQRMTEK